MSTSDPKKMGEAVKKGPWLVKSGDRILGPYSTDDLSQLIREKEVVVIDEIASPQTRWQYLRDVPAFQKVVEDIRRGLLTAREDTEVQGYTGATPTKTEPLGGKSVVGAFDPDNVTNTGEIPVLETETPATPIKRTGDAPSLPNSAPSSTASPIPSVSGAKGSAPGPAAVIRPGDKPAPVSVAPSAASKQTLAMTPLAHHSPETRDLNPKVVETQRSGGGRAPVIVGSLVLILAAGFIIYSVLNRPQSLGHSVSGSDNLQTQASVAWKRGEFERALELYRALNHDQPGQPLVAARLATLMMKLEGQTVEAKRVIESALPNAQDDDAKSALAIASGLAALQNDDAKEAAAHFAEAGSSWIAQFDEGVAQSQLKSWNEAIKAFDKAGDNAVSLIMLARTQLSAIESGAGKGMSRREANESVTKALVQAPDFQQEAYLIGAYVDAVSGNSKQAAKRALQALETDPQQTNDHFHDPALSLDQVSWTKLLPYCETINSTLASKVSIALLGICLAKANQLENASKLVEGEIQKDSSNSYLQAVQAYLNGLGDRDDAARASLTLSSKNGTSRLAQILSARLCMREKQDACAEDGWSKLASEDNPPIAAVTGLAQLRQAKGDASTANALLVKAETMSPHYLPLLRLREEASR